MNGAITSNCRRSLQITNILRRKLSIFERSNGKVCKVHTLLTMTDHYMWGHKHCISKEHRKEELKQMLLNNKAWYTLIFIF